MMRWSVSLAAGLALVICGFAGNSGPKVAYLVQLIRATDSPKALPAGSERLTSDVAGILHGPLKWKNYYKICEREVEVAEGQVKRVNLINGRAVEIDLTTPNKRTVTAFQDGRAVARAIVPVGKCSTLVGGARDADSGWFIVVRREHPPE